MIWIRVYDICVRLDRTNMRESINYENDMLQLTMADSFCQFHNCADALSRLITFSTTTFAASAERESQENIVVDRCTSFCFPNSVICHLHCRQFRIPSIILHSLFVMHFNYAQYVPRFSPTNSRIMQLPPSRRYSVDLVVVSVVYSSVCLAIFLF